MACVHDSAPTPHMRQLGRSRPYDLASLPARLRQWHAPRANRWECLQVIRGPLAIQWLDDGGISDLELDRGELRWIAPGTRWRVGDGHAEASFVLEIHADDATAAAAPQALRAALLDAAPVIVAADPAALSEVLATLAAGSHCLLRTPFDPSASICAALDAGAGALGWHPLQADEAEHVVLLVHASQPIGLLEYLGRDHAVIEAALAGALRGDAQRMRWLRNALARHLVIEEQLLFPAYLAAGGRAGWVRGLCNEHALLRRDLDRLHDAGARRRFLLLLDGHDEKEEQIVYPDIIARAVAGDDALTRAVLHLALPAASGALATATHGNSTGPAASTP